MADAGATAPDLLPPRFQAWFEGRGWAPRAHQLEMVAKGRAGRDALLIAPTGGGKTLAGFLPSLIELSERPPANTPRGLHTIYISPLKALAVDIERNLAAPISEIGLNVVAESRTGDTGLARRQRQRVKPPDILLTTPEQLALLCAWEGARLYFEDLRCVILDEIHTLHASKRGDLLALDLARLQLLAPGMRRVGLSATVDDPEVIKNWMASHRVVDVVGGGLAPPPALRATSPAEAEEELSPPRSSPVSTGEVARRDSGETEGAHGPSSIDLVRGPPGAEPIVEVLLSEGRVPWSGHTAQHAMAEVYDVIKKSRIALVFVNTRFQAEFAFQELWKLNEDGPPDRAAPRQPGGRAAAQGRGGDGRGATCGRWSAPRRWISASTGATWTW
jgi:ATP-dependent Lhr-like helicase